MTWDAITPTGAALHAVADWEAGRALCGAYVVPVTTSLDPHAWRPRCVRCTSKGSR